MQQYCLGLVSVWWLLLGLSVATARPHRHPSPWPSGDAHLGRAFWRDGRGGPAGESVVQEVLRILRNYLQAIDGGLWGRR